MARSLLAIDRKQVPNGMDKAICWPNSASIETDFTSLQHLQAEREVKSALRDLWIGKSNSALYKAKGSSTSASREVKVVSDCKTTPAPHKAQLRSSCEAKGKALFSATSEAAATLLSALSYEVTVHSGANSEATSLKGKALHSCAEALSVQITSPCGEAMPSAR